MRVETRPAGGLEGLTLRPGRPEDLEQIVALNAEHNGPDTDPMVRAAWTDVGPELFTVVCDGDRVVSTLVLLRDELRFREPRVTVPLGRPEYVVTDPSYRGRGLIRAQMDLVHRWSAERGEPAQMITGIPYFYRRFGYEYATKPRTDVFVRRPIEAPDGWTVRPAEHGDVDDIVRLQEGAQSSHELVIARTAAQWHAHLDITVEPYIGMVAVGPHGRVAGYGMPIPARNEAPPWLVRTAADEAAAVLALAWNARDERGLGVGGRPGTLAHRVLERLGRAQRSDWEPVFRVPDPGAFLLAVRPVLDARLAQSPFANASGELLLSFYRSSLTIRYEDGRIAGVRDSGYEQDPLARGGVGVPPDLVATLLLGGCGAGTLADRHRDVLLGRHEALMEVLFPEVEADLLTIT